MIDRKKINTYNDYLKWVIEVTNQEYNGSIKKFNKGYNDMYEF